VSYAKIAIAKATAIATPIAIEAKRRLKLTCTYALIQMIEAFEYAAGHHTQIIDNVVQMILIVYIACLSFACLIFWPAACAITSFVQRFVQLYAPALYKLAVDSVLPLSPYTTLSTAVLLPELLLV
jgi:hypothetical protein